MFQLFYSINSYTCAPRNIYETVHSSVLHNWLKLDTTQCSSTVEWVIHLYNEISFGNENEQAVSTCSTIEESYKHHDEQKRHLQKNSSIIMSFLLCLQPGKTKLF